MTQAIMQITDWLAAHGPIYLLGSTIVLGIGAALMLLCREPLYRQRLGELTIIATLVWCMLASIPLDRWSWVEEQSEPPVSIPAAPVLMAEDLLAEDAVPVLPVNEDVEALIAQLPVETKRSFAPPPSMQTVKPSFNWPLAIAAVYLVAAGICAVWLLTGRLVLTLLIRTANAPPDWLATVYEELAGADCRARLLVSRRFRRPICFGIRRPVILLPQHLCQPSQEQQLRHVLLHELAHVRQRDAVGNLSLNVALPALYFHPMYWWIVLRVRLARELVADDRAAASTQRHAYVASLTSVARGLAPRFTGTLGVLGLFRTQSQFYRRLKMLVERKNRLAMVTSRSWRTAGVAMSAVGVIALAAVLGLEPTTAVGDEEVVQTNAVETDSADTSAVQVSDENRADVVNVTVNQETGEVTVDLAGHTVSEVILPIDPIDDLFETQGNAKPISASKPKPKSSRSLEVVGLVELVNDVTVSSQVSGNVQEVKVREGQAVKKGERLVAFDDRKAQFLLKQVETDLQAALRAAKEEIDITYAKATVEAAEAELTKLTNINIKRPGSIPALELFRAKASIDHAKLGVMSAVSKRETQLSAARQKQTLVESALYDLETHRLTAPFDGTVVEIHHRVGEWVKEGEPLVRIVNLQKLTIKTLVSDEFAAPADLIGKIVSIKVMRTLVSQRTAKAIEAKITFASPIVRVGGTYVVAIAVENKRREGRWILRPGQKVRVTLPAPKQQGDEEKSPVARY